MEEKDIKNLIDESIKTAIEENNEKWGDKFAALQSSIENAVEGSPSVSVETTPKKEERPKPIVVEHNNKKHTAKTNVFKDVQQKLGEGVLIDLAKLTKAKQKKALQLFPKMFVES